ncbi:TolC family protein, partial [Verrucomicrobiota bacterium]
MVKKYIYFGMSAILALAGCAGPRGTGMPAPRPLGRDIQSFHASSEDVDTSVSAEAVERQDTITLRQALALALMKNPELAVYSWDIRAAEARILQAKALPNPEMGIEVEEFGGSGDAQGFDSAKMSIVLSQVIELGGKRAKRRNTAALEMDLAAWQYEAKRLDIL